LSQGTNGCSSSLIIEEDPALPSTDAKGIIRKHFISFWRRQATYGGISVPTENILTIEQIMQAINGVTLICIFSKEEKIKQ
jgi:hypothetical protein